MSTTSKDDDVMADKAMARAVPAEEWRSVVGFENIYLVSSLGRIRAVSPRRGNGLLFGEIDKDGYRRVNLSRDGKRFKRRVHRLVCEAFHGPCPDGHEAAHLDGTRLGNRESNLVWATRSENTQHQILHGTFHQNTRRGEGHPRAKLTAAAVAEIRARRRDGCAASLLAQEYGVGRRRIYAIVNNESWKHLSQDAVQ